MPDLRVLTFDAGRFDALILSHLTVHIKSNFLFQNLTSFGLREESARNPPGAPSHDPMVALLPLFDNRDGLKYIQIETAHGVPMDRLEIMISKWRRAETRLRGLRVTVAGGAEESKNVLDLLSGDGDAGDEDLLEDISELVIKVPSWNSSDILPTVLGYIVSRSSRDVLNHTLTHPSASTPIQNPHAPLLHPLTNLHTLSLGFGFAPAHSTVFKDATVSLANSIPSLQLVFWPGYRRPSRIYAVSISRRPKAGQEGTAWEDVTEDDLVMLGLVGGDVGFRVDEWAEGVGGDSDWARLLV